MRPSPLFLAVALWAAAVSPVFARAWVFPMDDPVVTFDIPDEWSCHFDVEGSFAAFTPAKNYFLKVTLETEGDTASEIAKFFADSLARKGGMESPEISDPKTQKVNGYSTADITLSGKARKEDLTFRIHVVKVGEDRAVIFALGGSPESDKANAAKAREIIGSIKKVPQQ